MRWTAILIVIFLAGCGGSGESELSKALDECLHDCTPGDEMCRDRCVSICVGGCLGDCPGFDCKPLLSVMREENPYGYIQDCLDSHFCMNACWCLSHDECLAAAEKVFGADAPCPDSLYDSCKDACYSF